MKKDSYYIKLEEDGFYDTVDKRSKDYREYKVWKLSYNELIHKEYKSLKDNIMKQPKGLGDVVANITKATGIDKVVKFIAGDDCGCDERRKKWNKIPMFKNSKPECIKEDDYNYLVDLIKRTSSTIDKKDQFKMTTIHNYIFKTNESKDTSCNSCGAKIFNRLKSYIETYK